jgi:hypothetical protein
LFTINSLSYSQQLEPLSSNRRLFSRYVGSIGFLCSVYHVRSPDVETCVKRFNEFWFLVTEDEDSAILGGIELNESVTTNITKSYMIKIKMV